MPRLVISKLGSATVMGQQMYEEQITRRAADALGDGWTVREEVLRSLRSPLPGTARLPAVVFGDAPAALRRVAGRLVHRRADVTHRMDLRIPPGRNEVVMIHDVVCWRYTDEGQPPAAAVDEVRRAAAVVTPSRFSAREVAEVFGIEEPIAIHNGVDPAFFDAVPLDDAGLNALGLRAPYVLHAQGCTERKNLAGLAAAWPVVRAAYPDCQLAMAGPSDPRRDRLFAGLDGVHLLGRVPDQTLQSLMAGAAAVVVPSRYEGFGLPVLEAMACGTPVVASNCSSLPEVSGDVGWLVDPDGPALAQGLISVLAGGPEVESRRRAGLSRAREFSWERSARQHAEVWKSLAG